MSYPVEAKHQIVVEKERQFLNFWLRLKPPFQRFYLLQVIWLSCTKFKLSIGNLALLVSMWKRGLY